MVARIIRTMYTEKRVANIFFDELLSEIAKKIQMQLVSRSEVHVLVTELGKIVNGWLRVISNQDGDILRVDKTVPFCVVLSMIKKFDSYKKIMGENCDENEKLENAGPEDYL